MRWLGLRRGGGCGAGAPALLHELTKGPFGLAAVLFEQPGGPGLIAVDRHGRIVRSNGAARLLAGSDADLSEGASVLALFGMDDGERDSVLAELAPALRGHAVKKLVTTVLRGGGAAVSVAAVTLRERDGSPCAALLRIVDISAQRELETQLAQAQKLQAMGQLAGGIAHDFNNLLTAMLGAAESVAGRTDLPSEVAEDVAQIRASAGRGAALVRQLLAFGRQQTLQPQVLGVNEMVTSLSGMLRRLLGSNVRLELELEAGVRQVRADPTQVDQVLVNLAVNARDAMPDGGTLTVRTGHRTLHRALTRGAEVIPPGRYVMVEVSDTGTGIPADVLPQIFDPFFTTRREHGGTGLGLSTVHGIVRQSDGFLEVESAAGQGTAIRVFLPRWDDRVPPLPAAGLADAVPADTKEGLPVTEQAAPIQPAPTTAPREGTVLLVDDEEPVRRLAERALARAGWQVLSADCGEAALAALATHEGRVVGVVTDMVMPGMDGVAVLRAVRARLQAPALPALLMSGYAEASLRVALAGESQVSFLAKPYALRELVDAFAAAVQAEAGPPPTPSP